MNNRLFSNVVVWVLIVTLVSLNYGCVSKRQSIPVNTHLDLYSKKIALVPSRVPIKNSLEGLAKGAGEGFVYGAGHAAVTTTAFFAKGGHCERELCGLFALVYLSALVVGVTLGSVYGAVTAPSGKTVQNMEEGLAGKTTEVLTQSTFADLLARKASQDSSLDIEMVSLEGAVEELNAKGYETLKTQGFQELISVNLTEIEFVAGEGKNPPLTMTFSAEVDILNLDRYEEKITRAYRYVGTTAYYEEWITKDAIELTKDFDLGVQTLINDIYHDIFVSFYLPISSGEDDFPGSGLFGCCWICPEYPPTDYSFFGKHLRFPLVDSLQPILKWSSFPDERQEKQFTQATGMTIKDVSYDLKIWQGDGDIVYEKSRIAENFHSLESDLVPNTNYYWSIRACFGIDEKSICTRWASSTRPFLPLSGGCNGATIEENFLRFRTP